MFLNCHTYYSLRYGTLSPEELVGRAKRWGITTLALTDINNTSCTFEFVRLCEREGIRPVAGIDFRRDGQRLYIGLARNAEGFYELNKLLTDCSLDGRPLPDQPPPLANAWIIYPRLFKPITDFRENELLGIRPEHVARLFSHQLLKYQHKLVVLSPVTFADDEGYQLHRLLQAIDQNTLLTKLDPKVMAKATERLIPPAALCTYYQSYPRILRNTERILASCSIPFESGLHNNRQTFTGSKEGDFRLLEKLALNGCERRYGAYDKKALERTRRELKVIREQDFCSYFLITWDIVRYAHAAGYHHVGRGSGANSIVAYCLHITDVDPLELGLYFERFINPYRSSPPDFDIDFSWDERDDVTDYIFKRYGREHTGLLATYSTFQGRAVVRELGKVYGLPKFEIDKIIADPFHPEEHHELAKTILYYGRRLEGFPNYLSIHAGGVVISEKPIHYFTALQMMPKGFPITHFDMYHAEELGFHKFDVLSQRGLGHIKDAVDLVKQNQGRAVDVHDVENIKQDPQVKAQLRSGNCMGCFYIESPAMRGLLKKLHCDNYLHLVAASSIIRPGVAQSGMMREYIRRFHYPHSFRYLHPVFEEQLGETFGVMVYQEDVMKIVHHFAGLGLDESDVLRRIMSGKKYKDDTFERLRQKYFDNCRARGHSEELAREVWRQVESFSGYSFCKAHSASFAVESFQSLYLKAYFPLEFMVAVINNFGGFYHPEYYFHEARMNGGAIHAPCVNHSQYLTTLKGKDIYIGFVHLHGMERQAAHRIVAERARGGPFRNLEDFINRLPITPEQLEILIRIGAFRFTGRSKYELMWDKVALMNPKEKWGGTLSLFGTRDSGLGIRSGDQGVADGDGTEFPPSASRIHESRIPNFQELSLDQSFDEIELLGFPLCSPFELLENRHCADCITLSARLGDFVGRVVKVLGYYVCKKDVRTSKGQLMAFGCWLGQDGHFFDTTHFPEFLKAFPFRGKGIYKIEGKVVEEFGFPSMEVLRMERLAYRRDERYGTG
ncbi:MAG: DNA polymerase III subunit alpha [Phaeodactylibacter sp.]|nr:DNA polymerase III subunit alpha [Phaeodactylibacter sp.]MCB9048299.1 DNA polymerase III subunit alpha [Lewinellaceae bacterium]